MSFLDAALLNPRMNNLIHHELSYDRVSLAKKSEGMISKLNDDQKNVYDSIIKAISKDKGVVFFVYGYEVLRRHWCAELYLQLCGLKVRLF